MNRKYSLESTKKLAKITRIVCRISIIGTIVGIALMIVTNIVIYAVPPDHLKLLQDPGKLGIFANGYIPQEVFTSVEALRKYLLELIARLSVGAAVFVAAALPVMGLLRSVENGTPFDAENVTRLRKIGIVLLVGSVIIPTITSFASIYSSGLNLMETKSNSMIDVTLLLCGFLILILAGVFSYGARLQREHDQTV